MIYPPLLVKYGAQNRSNAKEALEWINIFTQYRENLKEEVEV